MRRETLEETLTRYRAFWKREQTDRPILGVTLATYTPLEMFDTIDLPREGRVIPENLDVDVFLEWYEQDRQKNLALGGDQFWVGTPFWGVPWMGAIVGCPVQITGTSIWTEHYLEDYKELPEFDISTGNPWFQKLLEFTSRLVEHSNGNYPVAVPFLRGPSDIISALRGSQRFLFDLHDRPEEVHKLVDLLVDIWIKVAKSVLELIPPFHGGYCNGNRQVWAPGTCIETQEDAAGMISPKSYRDLFLPGTRRIVSSFNFGWMHIHSSYHHNINELLTIPELAAIEFTIDTPPGPSVVDLIPVMQRVQERKPIIVHGTVNLEEMKHLVKNLSPAGLCVISRVESVDAGNEMLDVLLAETARPI